MKHLLLKLAALALFSVGSWAGSPQPIKLTAPAKVSAGAGGTAKVRIEIAAQAGWHIYDVQTQHDAQGNGPEPTTVSAKTKGLFSLAGALKTSTPAKYFDEGFRFDIRSLEDKAWIEVPIKVNPDLKPGKTYDAVLVVGFMSCNNKNCLPPEEIEIAFKLAVTGSQAPVVAGGEQGTKEIVAAVQGLETPSAPAAEATSQSKQGTTASATQINDKKKQGVWSFLWFAMLAGLAALLTPCVFPMVPITVSFFTKRSENARAHGLRDAFVYAVGIISTFTALGIILALVFGASGIQTFATNPWINLLIAGIFIAFALNLFGVFEIQVPSSILNKLNSGGQGNGVIGILLMGLAFSLTSFTCTVPFVGSALISASRGEWFYPILGMLGFSSMFALPFFFLALFPSAMKKLPKAGGWMVSMKVVMGFLEIAAAIKFISNADLVWNWGFITRDLFLSIWIACATLITLYLLGVFRLTSDVVSESIGGIRALFATCFAALIFFLLSGLFGKPLGEMDAFLPPAELSKAPAVKAVAASVPPSSRNLEDGWYVDDYPAALAESKRTGKPLFIDFTGYTCTNCRWMEQNMFLKAAVQTVLDRFVKVRLYTDRKTEICLANKKMQEQRFDSIELPLYVLTTPDEKVITTGSFTRDEADFLTFLQKPM